MRLANPVTTWNEICFLAKNLIYTTSGTEISGMGLWILWGLEAFAIISATVLLSNIYIKKSVFCEACRCWTDDHKDKLTFEYLSENELKEKLMNQDMSFLDNFIEMAPGGDSFYRIDCRSCSKCKEFYTLSLFRITRTWSKEGQPSDKENYIMKNLFISKEIFDKLAPKPCPEEKTDEEAAVEEVVAEQ